MNKIRVMISDDIADTRESIRRLLEFEENIEVVAEAGTGTEALYQAEQTHPDVALMDINMPEMDGIRATELMGERFPEIGVIMLSVQNESECFRQAMVAGARDFIVKPFSGEQLAKAIMKVYETNKIRGTPVIQTVAHAGKTIAFFSTKGGVGKTALAVNLAVALGKRVLLADLDLQFGDCAVFLNMAPKRTLADLTLEDIKSCISVHSSGVDLLAAPMRPEYAETVKTDLVTKVLTQMKAHYDFILLDTPNRFEDISLAALDMADEIWLVLSMDLATLKNAKMSLDLMNHLGYDSKLKIILNRADGDLGMEQQDIRKTLGIPISFAVPSDGKAVVNALNTGRPFVMAYPQSKASEGIQTMAHALRGQGGDTPAKPRKFKLFGKGDQ